MEVEKFEEFFSQYYEKDLLTAAAKGERSLVVDFSLLDKFDPELADQLLNNPEENLEFAREALSNIDLPEGNLKIEPRFKNLPEQFVLRIRNLRSEHIGKFVSLDGIVKRASEVKPEVACAIYECPLCQERIEVLQTERNIKPPSICSNPECRVRTGFTQVDRKLFDARWIFIEEPFEMAEGDRPGGTSVYLKYDLTTPLMQRKTDPGNRIKVTGILKEIQRTVRGKVKTQMDTYVEANFVEPSEIEWEEVLISEEDEEKIKEFARDPEIYKKIVDSIAPSIFGLDEVKKAIMFQLFGGVPHKYPDKTKIRGDIHVLLIGDPSCLVADERVIMADGTIMKIGDMGSRHLEDINYNLHMGMGRKYGKATKFHCFKSQPIIEIVTETGKSIKGTPNQPVFVLKNRKRAWRRLDEVKAGDRVCTLTKIECRKKSLVETEWKDYKYHHKSWHIKIPKFVDKDLAALFGYLIADGWVRGRSIGFIVNKDECDITPNIVKYFEKCFDAPVVSCKQKEGKERVVYYEIDRTHLAKLLSFLKEKRVPNLIFKSGNSVVASFLRWLYEGDGCVFSKGRGRTSVSLKSNNIELLRDVQILLLRFGIHSRILWDDKKRTARIKGRLIKSKPSGSLVIRRSKSILEFSKHIGFASKKKISKMEKAVGYAKSHVRRVHKERSERIVKINKFKPNNVFDVEVPGYHRFVANGIVVHNTGKSQLLKLISSIIPRGKYVAGRGATAAGLTATVVKDEEFLGGWVLEAGAMVLANKGIIAIDEFDKMTKEDQIAMHEALEQQTVSIAKASIVATLPAQVSVLAGANPKYFRFDPYKSVAEQVDIPDTLLGRFDLKFALKDIPDKAKDERLASHIMETRLDPKIVKPLISPNFIRKYIAYARKNCKPEMTREAAERLKNFYLDMRSLYSGEGAIAITLRQNEGLLRISEASAKIRLSKKVEIADAERAIDVMRYSIKELGYDYETGKIDIDKTEGIPASQRSKIHAILDIIDMLEKKLGKPVQKEEIVAAAEEQGIKASSTEELLRRLKTEGSIFEPKINYIERIG
ncbi:MAG: LAGLIDADG family homing endonuclease [Candidatus Aenigmatarchaeota archaeon]